MHIIRVDDRIVHWIGGVDVDAAVTIRMLQSGSNAYIAISIAVHEENFNLADRAIEYRSCGRVANCRVSINNSVVVSRIRFVLTD